MPPPSPLPSVSLRSFPMLKTPNSGDRLGLIAFPPVSLGQGSSVVLLAAVSSLPSLVAHSAVPCSAILSRLLLSSLLPSSLGARASPPPQMTRQNGSYQPFMCGRPWVESTCASQESGARVCSPTDKVCSHRSSSNRLITPPLCMLPPINRSVARRRSCTKQPRHR